jgi:hypothetical protein
MNSHKKDMKRGRPSVRTIVIDALLQLLRESQVPMTISLLTRLASQKTGRMLSWNTVQKYLAELAAADKVQTISLPHSKEEGKKGLTVYILKR